MKLQDTIDLEQFEQPIIVIHPNPVDFGRQPLHKLKFATLYIRNPGGADLIVTEITDPTPPFGLDKPLLPLRLGPGEKLSLLVNIQPASEGSFSSSLRLVSNDPTTPVVNVDLIATATASASPVLQDRPHSNLPASDASTLQSKRSDKFNTASSFITNENWHSLQLHRSSQRKYYLILAFLSVALMAGLYFKFNASPTPTSQATASSGNISTSSHLKQSESRHKVYTVEELRLPQEIFPPPAKPAPPKQTDEVVDESWADLPDDNISQEQLDEMPVEEQKQIIERRVKIKLAREARTKRIAQGQPSPGTKTSNHSN
jgi:hypothetical protein